MLERGKCRGCARRADQPEARRQANHEEGAAAPRERRGSDGSAATEHRGRRGRDECPKEIGEETAQGGERSEGNADAYRRQEAGEGSRREKASRTAAAEVGLTGADSRCGVKGDRSPVPALFVRRALGTGVTDGIQHVLNCCRGLSDPARAEHDERGEVNSPAEHAERPTHAGYEGSGGNENECRFGVEYWLAAHGATPSGRTSRLLPMLGGAL